MDMSYFQFLLLLMYYTVKYLQRPYPIPQNNNLGLFAHSYNNLLVILVVPQVIQLLTLIQS